MSAPNQVYKNTASAIDDPTVKNQFLDDRIGNIEFIVSGGTGQLPIAVTPNSLVRYDTNDGAQTDTNIFTGTYSALDDSLELTAIDNPAATLHIGASTSVIDFHNTPVINFASVAPSGSYIAQPPVAATDANGVLVDNPGSKLTLEYADNTHPGIVSTTNQTFAGTKTFSNVVLTGLPQTGIVHNSSLGVLSTSLIFDYDVDPTANIQDTKLATIATAGKVSNSATTAVSTNTINTLVLRDGSGNFSANTITANLVGNASTSNLASSATTATSATFFTGSLSGDVTGLQGSTTVAFVGGQTAAATATAVTQVQNATFSNVANTLVMRSGSGDVNVRDLFAANLGTNGVINMPTTLSSTIGIIAQNGVRLLHTMGAANNVYFGTTAGSLFNTNQNSTAVGSQSQTTTNISGNDNASLGYNTLNQNTGSQNSAFGSEALATGSNMNQNSAFGYKSLFANSASGNSAFGLLSLTKNTTGTGNSAFGTNCLANITTNSNSTAMGNNALNLATGGTNSAFGAQTLQALTTGTVNSAFGAFALSACTASGLCAFGAYSLTACTTSTQNCAFGIRSLEALTTGSGGNTAMGFNALQVLATGSNCTAVGANALALATGSTNTVFGANSGTIISTGTGNICIGVLAGVSITTGSNNTFIGPDATTYPSGTSNSCFISRIRGVTCAAGNGITVYVDSNNQLGTAVSTRSEKKDIESVDQELNHMQLMAFQPRRFNYINGQNPVKSYGMIYDEVEGICDDLLIKDIDNNPHTLAYQHLNIMLLSELQRVNTRMALMEARLNQIV